MVMVLGWRAYTPALHANARECVTGPGLSRACSKTANTLTFNFLPRRTLLTDARESEQDGLKVCIWRNRASLPLIGCGPLFDHAIRNGVAGLSWMHGTFWAAKKCPKSRRRAMSAARRGLSIWLQRS